MWQIYKVRPSISPWKQNNSTEIFLFNLLLPSVSDNMSVKSIYFSKSLSICCKFLLHISTCSVPTQFYHNTISFISSLSNNTNCSNCVSTVSKQTQSKILQLPFGNLSIQILGDRSWQWAFATSFPGHCTHKASWVPHFSWATLFNGRDSVMNLWIGRLRNASCVLWQLKLGTCFTFTISSASSDIVSLLWLTAKNN